VAEVVEPEALGKPCYLCGRTPRTATTAARSRLHTYTVSALGKFSRESLAQPNAAQLILASMRRSVVTKADLAFIANATAPTGLLNVAGITAGGTVGANLDTLIDAAAGIEADGGTATDLIAALDLWAALSKMNDRYRFGRAAARCRNAGSRAVPARHPRSSQQRRPRR
jgi:hypothetical protein